MSRKRKIVITLVSIYLVFLLVFGTLYAFPDSREWLLTLTPLDIGFTALMVAIIVILLPIALLLSLLFAGTLTMGIKLLIESFIDSKVKSCFILGFIGLACILALTIGVVHNLAWTPFIGIVGFCMALAAGITYEESEQERKRETP